MADLTGNLATDEKLLREAVTAKARDVLALAPFDFPETNFHSRRRFIADADEWLRVTSIVDPDNEEEAPGAGQPDMRPRVMRLVTAETQSSDYNNDSRLWKLTFAVKVGFGFVDERPEGRGNSYDELMRAVYTLLQQYLEDSALGFSVASGVTVYRTRHTGTRMVAADKQGKAAHVADLEVFANVEVC